MHIGESALRSFTRHALDLAFMINSIPVAELPDDPIVVASSDQLGTANVIRRAELGLWIRSVFEEPDESDRARAFASAARAALEPLPRAELRAGKLPIPCLLFVSTTGQVGCEVRVLEGVTPRVLS